MTIVRFIVYVKPVIIIFVNGSTNGIGIVLNTGKVGGIIVEGFEVTENKDLQTLKR